MCQNDNSSGVCIRMGQVAKLLTRKNAALGGTAFLGMATLLAAFIYVTPASACNVNGNYNFNENRNYNSNSNYNYNGNSNSKSVTIRTSFSG